MTEWKVDACPFCGSNDTGAEYEDDSFAEFRGWRTYCGSCQASGPFCSEETYGEDAQSEAEWEWNRMARATAKRAESYSDRVKRWALGKEAL